ncbi:MAG: Fur family transcriptional regulator [Sphingomonadaceae bacterium]
MSDAIDIEALCHAKGLRITEQRRIIARVLSDSRDHPDVDELHRRAVELDRNISIATVYRTVRLFEDAGILERHDFRDGRSRYEPTPDEHHDHLINVETGDVIEFHDEKLESLKAEIARQLGYRLVDHRLELYGAPIKSQKEHG